MTNTPVPCRLELLINNARGCVFFLQPLGEPALSGAEWVTGEEAEFARYEAMQWLNNFVRSVESRVFCCFSGAVVKRRV